MNSLKFQDRLLGLQDNLLNFAYMLTANREEAKDLLQDTTLNPIRRRAPSSANDIFPVRNRRRHRTPPQPTTVLFRKPLRNPLPEKRGCEKRSE